MNVALGDFSGLSYNTNFLCILRPVPGEYFTKFLGSCSKIHDMQGPNIISV